MEKFGLFDLIDKFNAVANGKNDFSKSKAEPQNRQGGLNGGKKNDLGYGDYGDRGNGGNNGDGKDSANAQAKLVDPQIFPPAQYMMNAKLRDFNKKHDEFARRVK